MNRFDRRDFLRIGCAASLGVAVDLNAANWKPAGHSLRLSVAHAEQSDFIDVRSISGGDPQFFHRDLAVEVRKGSCPYQLDALYIVDIDGQRRLTPFSVAGRGPAHNRLKMPVDPADGVSFELIGDERHLLRFTINSRREAIPLRRGTYAIVVRDERAGVDWRSLPSDALLLTFDYAPAGERPSRPQSPGLSPGDDGS